MENEVEKLLEELTELLPSNVNGEIAEVAGVSKGWVSEVRNGKKKSRSTQKAIAQVAIEKGEKLKEKGIELYEALEAAA